MIVRLARVFLALALLAAWQGALLHPLKHVDPAGALVHVGGGHAGGQGGSPDGLCDALAALTACAPGSQQVLVAPDPADSPISISYGALRQAEAPPFLAQGPPKLL